MLYCTLYFNFENSFHKQDEILVIINFSVLQVHIQLDELELLLCCRMFFWQGEAE